jgi:histidinol-phosphate aminotransferase
MSIVKLARPAIQAMQPYEAAIQVDNTVRLNANESPQISSAQHFRRPLNRYPEVRPLKLNQSLAKRFGCKPSQLLVTRGSSEAIDLLVRTFCESGNSSVVTPTPSFSMYWHYARIQGAAVIEVPTQANDNFRIDIDAILSACTDTSRLIFVCSPNNPTGASLSRSDIVRLLEGRENKSAVVVDEAYIEFSEHSSVIDLIGAYPNLIVLRTLSKALGFAGARCGAVAGAEDVIRMLNAVQSPYALATPVIECVEDALQDDQLTLAEQVVTGLIQERKRVTEAVKTYAWVKTVWPSQANFFLIQVQDAEAVMAHCAQNNILLRHFGGALADCIRISVGSVTDNNQLLAAFNTFGEQHDGS